MKRLLLIIFYVMLSSCLVTKNQMKDNYKKSKIFERSIGILQVSKQEPDFNAPWKFKKVKNEFHLGAAIRTPLHNLVIITTAYAVEHGSSINFLPYFNHKRIPLETIFVDREINLALLTAQDPGELKGLIPLELGENLEIGEQVNIYTDQKNIKLEYLESELSGVEIYESLTSSYQSPHYLFSVNRKNLGWAEPVVKDGRLMALISGRGKEYTYAIPSMIIRHFIQDNYRAQYKGFPALGVYTQSLTSPMLRQYLKVKETSVGVRIAAIEADSPFVDDLRVNDVLVSIAGKKISQKQMIKHSEWGQVAYVLAYNSLYPGDSLSLEIMRDGNPLSFTRTLKKYRANNKLIWQYFPAAQVPHLIFGGLVFQELSLDYLETWGKSWRSKANSSLLYQWYYKNLNSLEQKRVVVMTNVLADKINLGYESLQNKLLEKVNHISVRNMAEINSALGAPLEKNGKKYAIFEFSLGHGEIILSYQDLEKAHTRIAKRYGIHTKESFY